LFSSENKAQLLWLGFKLPHLSFAMLPFILPEQEKEQQDNDDN